MMQGFQNAQNFILIYFHKHKHEDKDFHKIVLESIFRQMAQMFIMLSEWMVVSNKGDAVFL